VRPLCFHNVRRRNTEGFRWFYLIGNCFGNVAGNQSRAISLVSVSDCVVVLAAVGRLAQTETPIVVAELS